jgi:hypothetical protein
MPMTKPVESPSIGQRDGDGGGTRLTPPKLSAFMEAPARRWMPGTRCLAVS